MHRTIFLTVFLSCYSFKILPSKPLGCSSFSFALVRITPTFQMTRYAFPGGPWGLVRCFSVVGCMKSRLGKLALKSEDGRCAQFSIGKETCLWRSAYLCMSVIQALLAFIVCNQAAFKLQVKGLLTWVRKDKQIYIHTYIHTNTHTFRKTISGNQACAWLKIVKEVAMTMTLCKFNSMQS